MRGAGGERTLNALLTCRAPLRCRACIAALPAILHERETERAYRVYVTDSLRAIAENTGAAAAYYSDGKMGRYPNIRFAELFEKKKAETRGPEEVKTHMMDRLRTMEGGES